MRYTSTRDRTLSFSFEEALCSGYAPDGGLFVPSNLPKIDAATQLKLWSKLPYSTLAMNVIRMFISPDEISDSDLQRICTKSFTDGFEDGENPVPVRRVGSAFVAELFHGPTFCFKDLGMRAVINILSHFSTMRKRRITLLVSTTGDTGPAAVQAVNDAANPLLTLLVHYPKDQISAFQRKQMTTVNSPQVHVVTFEGGGDDMDAPIKRILSSSLQSKNTNERDESNRMLCGVNSYNIGRPLMQMVHFIWTYLRIVEQLGIEPGNPNKLVDIILPTGAMGNIAGGYMAKKMGVPIGMLCAGVNINDITFRVINSGNFFLSSNMEKTLSDAINIQFPYNFERLLYYLTNENDKLVKRWMTEIDTTRKLALDHSWHKTLQKEFRSARITDDEMCSEMTRVRDNLDYYTDPHTAVAIAAAEKLGYGMLESNSSVFAILATASPCKFQEAVTVAMGSNGWDQYFHSEFPDRAKSIIAKHEVPPTLYPWKEGCSLSEVQLQWEKMAKEIITDNFV